MTDEPIDRRSKPRSPFSRGGDALYRLLRFIGRHIRGFYGAVITYLSFSFFVGLAAIWGFLEFGDTVLDGETQRFDEAVVQWVATHRSDLMDHIALEVTALGNTLTLALVVILVSVFLWLSHHRYSVVLLVIAVAGGGALNWLLKDIYNRPRPTVVDWGTDVMTQSFPSGHAMSAMVAYGSVAYLCGRLEPTERLRWSTWIFAAVLILAIGASRIYLGVHYPSDVVAGYIGGLAWTAIVISGLTAIAYFARDRKPDAEKEERDLQKAHPDEKQAAREERQRA